jgi:hypothetical protein
MSVDTASQHFKKSHTESMFWLLCKKYCESFYMKIHYILKMVSVCFAVSCFFFHFIFFMFMSFNNNTMGVTGGAKTVLPFKAPESTPAF